MVPHRTDLRSKKSVRPLGNYLPAILGVIHDHMFSDFNASPLFSKPEVALFVFHKSDAQDSYVAKTKENKTKQAF